MKLFLKKIQKVSPTDVHFQKTKSTEYHRGMEILNKTIYGEEYDIC